MPSDSSGTSRVLCILDDSALRASVRAPLLAAGWQVVDIPVADARDLWPVQRPDVIVLECGSGSARELLEEHAGPEARTRIPLIAIGSAEDCLKALSRGATDWIVPPVVSGLLVHRVAVVVFAARCARDLGRLREGRPEDEVAEASTPSPRERFLQRADAILRTPRPRGDTAMLVLSILAADSAAGSGVLTACLPTMAERLSDVLSAGDEARAPGSGAPMSMLEGSEFTVFLGHEERAGAAYQIARRLQLELEKPAELGDRPHVSVQVDVGIALFSRDGVTATELHAAARRAMARAREDQLRGIRFATAAMNAGTFERQTLESSLRYALERGELMLYYQPRVEITTGRLVGMEALLRWQHPELGLVSPGHFISIAEESGLIVPIGEWVLREACRQNQSWRDAGLPAIRIAVNLSSVQFRQPDLEVRIAQVLEETGLEPGGLELELTESLLFQDADLTTETLRTIKEMGVHLSIDDFGTGYSSLSYIKRFPVDALKIDQSFVREMTTSPESSAITTSIVLMGKSLGLTVVAEGVETRSQLEFLRALECDEAQGYLFSRPVPAREAGEWVAGTLTRTGS